MIDARSKFRARLPGGLSLISVLHRRKVRCTGQQPCRLCSESSAVCSYNASYSRGRRPARPGPSPGVGSESTALYPAGNGFESQPDPHRTGVPVDELISPASPEPTQTDLEGHYVGPSSGISFLSRVQKRLEESVSFSRGLSVFNFGDAPLAYQSGGYSTPVDAQPGLDLAMFFLLKREDTTRLVARYFDFAVPLDRFLHRPTVEKWLDEFYETKGRMHSKEAAPAQTAVLFIVFAVAQEHSSPKLSAEEADMRFVRSPASLIKLTTVVFDTSERPTTSCQGNRVPCGSQAFKRDSASVSGFCRSHASTTAGASSGPLRGWLSHSACIANDTPTQRR